MTIGATTPATLKIAPAMSARRMTRSPKRPKNAADAIRKNAPATMARSSPSRATRTITTTSSERKTLGRRQMQVVAEARIAERR